MKRAEINWLDDEPQAEVPRTPTPTPPRAPPPPARGYNWWTCGSEGCRMNGYAATADYGVDDRGEPVTPSCGFCREPLVFLQKGGYPTGYPRHEVPDVAQGNMRGNAHMGRVRIVE